MDPHIPSWSPTEFSKDSIEKQIHISAISLKVTSLWYLNVSGLMIVNFSANRSKDVA